MQITWQPFDYNEFDPGLYWLAVLSPDVDIDADNDGRTVGKYTGKLNQKVVLCWVDHDTDGYPVFDPVDAGNLGQIHEDETVSHCALVQSPAFPESKQEGF